MEEEIKKVDMYTDGSCLNFSKKGAYAAVILYNDKALQITGSSENTTNNKMELIAVIEGLKALKTRCEVRVFSDSSYVVDNIIHNVIYEWRKTNFKHKKNVYEWKELIKLLTKHKVKFIKVKAHNEDRFNEMCHNLAYNSAIISQKEDKKYIKIS